MLAKYENLVNKNNSYNSSISNLAKPGLDVLIKTTNDTKTALEKLLNSKIKTKSFQATNNDTNPNANAKYIRYTPSIQGIGNSGLKSKNLANTSSNNLPDSQGFNPLHPKPNSSHPNLDQRIIKITELPRDPLELTKFKHKRIPRDSNEEFVPVMHSPPRKLTLKDQMDFKIPPCVSNWKNAKGYTIPMEMRLAADGRNMRDFTISDKFSKFADVMYMTEKIARNETEERSKIQDSIKMVDTLKKEQELKEAAKEARMKKTAIAVSNISSVNTTKTEETEIMLGHKRSKHNSNSVILEDNNNEELEQMKNERNNLRNLRKKEIENQRRMEMGGKNREREFKNNPRDEDRDISEKIALGQAQPSSRDTMIDARLYNQSAGLDTGFKGEEDYDLYDKPLFADRTATTIYKNIKANTNIDDDDGDEAATVQGSKKLMEKIHQRGKMFEGADISKVSGTSGRPIEFEKTKEEYGLNNIHSKSSKKKN